jgi:Glycosyl transferase family 41
VDERAERERALTAAARGDDHALFVLVDRWQGQWRLHDAQSLLHAALPSPIDHAHAHFQLSILAMHQGFAGEAFVHADTALRLAPRNRVIWDHALTLEKLHEPQSPARFLNRHRLFGAQFAADEANARVRVARTLDHSRVLRVAYLTPDAHLAMARFTDCLMTLHDPVQIEASFYYAFDTDLREVQTPFPQAPPVRAASSGADLVIGASCIPLRLSDHTLALGRRVLEALPRARLLMLGVAEGRAQQRVRNALAGLDPARIELQPRLTLTEYYRAIDRMDIVLDPGPFSGATATLDCLWQGIPVVTLPGALPHSRSTASIVSQLGFDGWIARDESHIVEIVTQLARDEAARSRVRESLRTRLLTSSLVDGKLFINALESALRRAWRHYVHSQDLALPFQHANIGDNHRAERQTREARRAIDQDAAAPVRQRLDEALRQMPCWSEIRQRYWALVRDAALKQSPPPPDTACKPVAATLLSSSPDAQAIRTALPWRPNSRGMAIAAGESMHAIYRALARGGADEDWLLLGDARARSAWPRGQRACPRPWRRPRPWLRWAKSTRLRRSSTVRA